jgi:hypothetical protein
MEKRNEWDFSETGDDFTLVEDFEIIDTGDFEIIDLDKEIGQKENNDADFEKESFESIFEENDEESGGEANVIEPSTLIEENLIAETGEEASEAASPEAEKEITSDEVLKSDIYETDEFEENPRDEVQISEELEEAQEAEDLASETKEEERGEEKMVGNFKVEELNGVLNSLLDVSPDFEAAAIVSTDGFVIASVLPSATSDEKVGAMSAAILSLGERASSELGKGNLETVFVEGESGYLILTSITDDVLLLLSTSKYAKLGLVFYELSNVKKALVEHFNR